MTSVEIIDLWYEYPFYKKIFGFHIDIKLLVDTTPGLTYNIVLISAVKKWLWIKLKTYIPDE